MSTTPNTPAANQSFWGRLANMFKHAAVEVADWFKAELGPEAHTVAVGLKALLETEAGQLARAAVASVQTMEGSGAEKFTVAKNSFLFALKNAGQELKDSTVNLILEAAVTELRGAFTAAPAA